MIHRNATAERPNFNEDVDLVFSQTFNHRDKHPALKQRSNSSHPRQINIIVMSVSLSGVCRDEVFLQLMTSKFLVNENVLSHVSYMRAMSYFWYKNEMTILHHSAHNRLIETVLRQIQCSYVKCYSSIVLVATCTKPVAERAHGRASNRTIARESLYGR